MTEFLISSTMFTACILILRAIFKKRLRPAFIYALWLAVLLRLFIPLSLFNITAPYTVTAPIADRISQADERAKSTVIFGADSYKSPELDPLTPIPDSTDTYSPPKPYTTAPGLRPMSMP